MYKIILLEELNKIKEKYKGDKKIIRDINKLIKLVSLIPKNPIKFQTIPPEIPNPRFPRFGIRECKK